MQYVSAKRLRKSICPPLQANKWSILEGAIDCSISPRLSSAQRFGKLAIVEDMVPQGSRQYLLREARQKILNTSKLRKLQGIYNPVPSLGFGG